MFDNLFSVATQVGVLFALMAVGFVCNRTRLLVDSTVKAMVDFLVMVVTPSLIVHSFQRPYDPKMIGGLAVGFAISFAVIALGIAASYLVLVRNGARRRTLRFATVFSNAGFMGIPLEQAILGMDGVFYGTSFVVVFNIVCWSWGLAMMSGGGEPVRLKTLLLNPGLIGLAVGLPLFFAPFRLPVVVGEPLRMLSDLNTPLAMLSIGYYLSQARFRDVLVRPAAWMAAGLRLVALPVVTVAFLLAAARVWPQLAPKMLVAMTIAAAAPVAALTTVFSVRYNGDVSTSVGMVAGTTLLSIVTLPPVIAFALSAFPGAI